MESHDDPHAPSLADLLLAAADGLTASVSVASPHRDLLVRLGYDDRSATEAPHRAALLRAAACFSRLFTLDAPDAPGLVTVGAEAAPGVPGAALGSVGGTGLAFGRAFEACVGEGAEFVSQFLLSDDPLIQMPAADALAMASPALRSLWDRLSPYRTQADQTRTTWIRAADLADGSPVYLPADLCVRRSAESREIVPPWPLGAGCGAGRTLLEATLHGLLELIERDAVALWWRGGQRARLLPNGLGAERLAALRRGGSQRRTWLLDITSDLAVPAVVAASCNDDGFGLCCGFAARPTLAGAADAALMEMAQMELAHHLTASKRAVRGDAALNDVDRRHVARFTTIAVAAVPALHPMAPPAPPADLPQDDSLAVLAALRDRLSRAGLAPCVVDLTRDTLGIPVTRVVCPGLEPGLAGPAGPRLAAASSRAGRDPDDYPPL